MSITASGGGPLFSPSQTTDWSRCPTLWDWKKRWEPVGEMWTPELAIGTALHAGIAQYWRGLLHQGDPRETPEHIAASTLAAIWPPDAPVVYSQESAQATISRLLDAFPTWVSTGMVALPLAVEKDYGEARVDLITEEAGDLVVTDWKYHANVPADRLHYRTERLSRSHQAWHYIWRVGQDFGRMVSRFRHVLLIGGPRLIIRDYVFTVEPDALAAWLHGAESKWMQMSRMNEGMERIYRREEGCYPYGEKYPCPAFDGCWRLHGNESKYDALYHRRA